jgi:hypothetical protein
MTEKNQTVGISFPPDILSQARDKAGRRNLSKFVSAAVAAKLAKHSPRKHHETTNTTRTPAAR